MTFKVSTTAAQASPNERTYHRFSDLADEVVDARIYLGFISASRTRRRGKKGLTSRGRPSITSCGRFTIAVTIIKRSASTTNDDEWDDHHGRGRDCMGTRRVVTTIPFLGDHTEALRITGAPREAHVFADGYYVGIVNDFDGIFQHLNLEAGPHRIEMRYPRYETIAFDVMVQPGRQSHFARTVLTRDRGVLPIDDACGRLNA